MVPGFPEQAASTLIEILGKFENILQRYKKKVFSQKIVNKIWQIGFFFVTLQSHF